MKISYNWLKDFINVTLPVNEVETLLTDLGLEVEGVEVFESIKGSLNGIVVGKVLECDKHPNADRLKVTTVDIGEKAPVQIVCGAPNVEKNQLVPVAKVGTTLYNDKGEGLKIKKGKIRGEVSNGMICAEDEIGLGASHDGILILDGDYNPGQPLSEVFSVEIDHVFEIGLTPNRADAMSHWGVARDLRAGIIQQGTSIALNTPSVSSFHVEKRTNKVKINVENSELVPRYCGITISDVKVEESPSWIQNRLKAIGINPKNNIVDITNYVMHELGQPLHAFDADRITSSTIHVKTLSKETRFTTLDDVERTLSPEDIMICDADKPLCIAGVLGGLDSGVSKQTRNIFLESAYFDPVTIRKTAKRHGINTDASFRFERGIDPNITEVALKRAAILITEICNGKLTSDIDDFYPKKIEDKQVFLTFDTINSLVGEVIDKTIIKSILTSLDIKVNNVSESGMGLTIPPYRVDVNREVDVIEEILRVYGYNSIQLDNKFHVSVSNSSRYEDHLVQNKVANYLVSRGYYETMSNSLTTSDYISLTETLEETHNVDMLNPLSQDLAVLRQSLLFSSLENVKFNLNRKNADLKFFEFGKTYHRIKNTTKEQKHLSITLLGNTNPENWINNKEQSSFFDLKGIIDAILERLSIQKSYASLNLDLYSEGVGYSFKDKNIVSFGIVNPKITSKFGIDKDVLYADFNWDYVLELVGKSSFKPRQISKYPEVKRDFALLIDDAVTFDELKQLSLKTERKLLTNVNLFDVYRGEKLPKGKKSYALSFTFVDHLKTLTDKQVDRIMNKLKLQFEKEFGAELR